MFNPITNHVQQALARLMSQYQDSPNLTNFITAIVNPAQTIENVLNDMNTLRMLSVATGQQLDNIGKIVGLVRPTGTDDDTYRRELYGQIKVNTSQGQPEQAIQTFQLFTGVPLIILDEYFPAEVIIESQQTFPTQALIDQVIQLMQEVLPAGVRCYGIVEFDPVAAFSFDGSLPGAGFGDAGDPTVGGLFAKLDLRGGEFAFAGDDPTAEGFGSTDDPLVGGRWVPLPDAPYYFSSQVPSSGDQVDVQLVVPNDIGPLLPLTGVTGFTVLVNSVPATISSAESQFNTKIILALSSPLIHNGDTVTVAYSPGNVTDSAGTALAAFSAQSVTNNSTQ